MKRSFIFIQIFNLLPAFGLALLCFFPVFSSAQKSTNPMINWRLVGRLPATSIGVAGAFAGVSNEAFLVAGGTNFPDAMPWKGGQKKYHADIWVYQRAGSLKQVEQKTRLQHAAAYGASVSTSKGILCIGGEDENGPVADVFLLHWHAKAKKVEQENMPPLPVPMSNMAASIIGDKVYVAGGEQKTEVSNKLLCLDLGQARPQWRRLADLPQALSHAVLVAQSNGEYPCLYLLGGRTRAASGVSTTLHSSVFEYDTQKQRWATLEPMGITNGTKEDTLITLSAAMGVAQGATSILLFGGDRGNISTQIEQLNNAIALADTEAAKASMQGHKEAILDAHPGFSKEVFVFNTVSKVWVKAGDLPYAPIATTAVRWGEDILVPSGEIRPGTRTIQILGGNIAKAQLKNNIGLYLLLLSLLCLFVLLIRLAILRKK